MSDLYCLCCHDDRMVVTSPSNHLSAGMRHAKNRGGLKICSYPLISPELCAPVVLSYCAGGEEVKMEGEGWEGRGDGLQRMKLLVSIV